MIVPTKVLSVNQLHKRYRDVLAVDGISFDVGHSEVVGLLGPNGAGKTTTINMILGVLQPSSGTISIQGADIETNRSQALEGTNFAAVYAPLPGNLTVYENLRFFGLLYGVRNLRERISVLLEQFELAPFRDVKSGVLSSGEQTRLSLAKAMINHPRLLLLDEPTASLDPAAARDVRAKILEFVAQGMGGVLWTSHNMYEVEEVCDRVLFLSHGKILLEGKPKTLAREHGKETLEELFITVAREPLTTWGRLSIMHFNRTAAIVLRQYYLIRGSLSRVVPLFAWVAIDMVLWGFITRYLNTVTMSGFNFVSMLLGAVLLWDFLVRVMQGVTIAFFEDVWSRNFLNIFAAPLSISEYLIGLVLSSVATSLIGLLMMIVLASTLFGLAFFAYGLMLVPFLLVLFLFGIALGILSSAIVLRLGPASEWFIWPIPALISPFVGVFYPLATLPGWMRYLSYLLPPSHVFEGMRTIVHGGTVAGSELFWSGCLAAFYILFACWFFSRMYGHAVRTGLIARYSAETLS